MRPHGHGVARVREGNTTQRSRNFMVQYKTKQTHDEPPRKNASLKNVRHRQQCDDVVQSLQPPQRKHSKEHTTITPIVLFLLIPQHSTNSEINLLFRNPTTATKPRTPTPRAPHHASNATPMDRSGRPDSSARVVTPAHTAGASAPPLLTSSSSVSLLHGAVDGEIAQPVAMTHPVQFASPASETCQ